MSKQVSKQKNYDIYTFHGSPGTEADFSLVSSLLPKNKLIPWSPLFHHNNKKASYFLAYSFGVFKSLVALKQLAEHKAALPKAIFCVAPFLHTKKPSAILETFVNSKFSNPLLSVLSISAIKKFVQKSAAPCAVPEDYLRQIPKLAEAQVIKQMLLERRSHESLIHLLQRAEELSVPLFLIHGEEDQSSPLSDLPTIAWKKKEIIKGAGHALVWTHPQEISRFIQNIQTIQTQGDL